MNTYDRRKLEAAGSIDLHTAWAAIVRKHELAEEADFKKLLSKLVAPFRSAGLVLDVDRSYLSKRPGGSDPTKMEGELVLTQKPGPYPMSNATVRDLVVTVADTYGFVRADPSESGKWVVEIGD